jgi:hypothetical protein
MRGKDGGQATMSLSWTYKARQESAGDRHAAPVELRMTWTGKSCAGAQNLLRLLVLSEEEEEAFSS